MSQTEPSPPPSGDDDDGIDTVPNPERGCGYLKPGKAYLKGEMGPGGVLPPFVEFDEPVPWLEGQLRGYARYPGVQFERTVTPTFAEYANGAEGAGEPYQQVGEATEPAVLRDNPDAVDAVREITPAGENWVTRTDPPLECDRHLTRLANDTPDGGHAGNMRVARSHDLLMWCGESYYDTPDVFIDECRTLGLSKAIPTSKNQEPPVINPGRTRVFIIHPKGVPTGTNDEGEPTFQPGIIGYAYVTRVIYTGAETGDGVDFPEWAREFAAAGRMDLVEIGAKEPARARENGSTIADYTGDGDGPTLSEQTRADIDESREQAEQGDTVPMDDVFAADATNAHERAENASTAAGDADATADTSDATEDDTDDESGPVAAHDVREVLESVPYNKLKATAAEHDLDVGPSPDKDTLIDAVIDAGLARPHSEDGGDGE